jgi:predicted MFS family arabinose efflux permease
MRSITDPVLYNRSFVLMATANFFTVSSIGAFFLFPLFITSHGGSKADIGIIMGALSLSAVVCRPWISEMIDGLGRKRSYTVGCIIMSLIPLAYLLFRGDLAHFYLPLLLIRVIHGVGLALCFTSAFTYIADIVPESRLNEGIGMFGTTGLTGMAVGPAIGETVIRAFGFHIFFLSATIMATTGFCLQLALPESYTRVTVESSESFFSVLNRKKILIVALLALLFGFALSASGSFVSPFAKEKHLAFISLYYIFYSSAAVLTRLLGGRLADRVGEDRIIPNALVLTGAGLLLLIFLEGNFILILSGLMSGCGHGFLFPCLNSLAIRGEPVHTRGKINGVFTGGIDAGVFLGSIILGFMGEWAGFRALFLVAGISLLPGLWIYRLLTKR